MSALAVDYSDDGRLIQKTGSNETPSSSNVQAYKK